MKNYKILKIEKFCEDKYHCVDNVIECIYLKTFGQNNNKWFPSNILGYYGCNKGYCYHCEKRFNSLKYPLSALIIRFCDMKKEWNGISAYLYCSKKCLNESKQFKKIQ
jgi:hypothetical protein